MTRRKQRKTALVPRIVFTVAVAGVVPAIAAGCGDDETRQDDDDDNTGGFAGVAAVAMGGFGGVAAVAMGGFGGVAAVAMGGFGGVGGGGGVGGAGGGGGAGGQGGMGALDPPPSGVDAPWLDPPAQHATVRRTRAKQARPGRRARRG
jgi:hypothetical protein